MSRIYWLRDAVLMAFLGTSNGLLQRHSPYPGQPNRKSPNLRVQQQTISALPFAGTSPSSPQENLTQALEDLGYSITAMPQADSPEDIFCFERGLGIIPSSGPMVLSLGVIQLDPQAIPQFHQTLCRLITPGSLQEINPDRSYVGTYQGQSVEWSLDSPNT